MIFWISFDLESGVRFWGLGVAVFYYAVEAPGFNKI